MPSPTLRRTPIVPFAEHSNRYQDSQINGFTANATPPPPPSVSPPPLPPPPSFPPPSSSPIHFPSLYPSLTGFEIGQMPIPNWEFQMAITETASELLQPHNQVDANTVNQEIIPSFADIQELLAKKGAEQTQLYQMALSQMQTHEKENSLKQTEKDRQISELMEKVSQLQGEVDNFRTEREDLIKYKENYEKAKKMFLGDK